ncbi:MAG TPA: ATP-binding protein [Streptosporangiaceae bacterium]|jgi:anti-sigma regulatory factor (Ser/Thr protein kinase)
MCTGVPTGCRPATDLRMELPPDARAAGAARAFVRRHLPELGFPKLVDNACLVAAELTTNAMKYASSHGPIWLSIRLAASRVLLEVEDGSPELPVLRDPDHLAESGRGLHVVAAFSAAFNWRRVGDGKIVWALLE